MVDDPPFYGKSVILGRSNIGANRQLVPFQRHDTSSFIVGNPSPPRNVVLSPGCPGCSVLENALRRYRKSASAGNRTRVWSVAGNYSTPRTPMPIHPPPGGLEPPTTRLRALRSTNWARAAYCPKDEIKFHALFLCRKFMSYILKSSLHRQIP